MEELYFLHLDSSSSAVELHAVDWEADFNPLLVKKQDYMRLF